jgi:hypothetical protein
MLCILASSLGVSGCVGFQNEQFLEPTPTNFHDTTAKYPFYRDTCNYAHDSIIVPLGSSSLLKLHAQQGYYGYGRTGDGTIIFGELYITPGSKLRFVDNRFAARDETESNQYSEIKNLKRTIRYGPKRTSASSMLDARMTSNDLLEGWTPEQAAHSGLIPPGMFVQGDLLNVFYFEAIWDRLRSEHFSVTTPAMELDGNVIGSKTILFRRVEKAVFVDPWCS